MNADKQDKEFKYKELTAKIIEIFYRVYNKLGYGFLEIVKNWTQIPARLNTDKF